MFIYGYGAGIAFAWKLMDGYQVNIILLCTLSARKRKEVRKE
jgi:hypothetical protein